MIIKWTKLAITSMSPVQSWGHTIRGGYECGRYASRDGTLETWPRLLGLRVATSSF